jgi:hypothetical protein
MPQHKQEVVNHRRHQVAELYLGGKYQVEIARLVGVSQQQVSLDLKAVQRAWLASSIRNFDEVKAEQLAKIDRIEREAWSAWERSLQVREVTVQEVIEGEHRTHKVSRRKEPGGGDPRYLQIAQRCIDQRIDLLGIGASAEAHKALATGLASLLAQATSATDDAPPMAEA